MNLRFNFINSIVLITSIFFAGCQNETNVDSTIDNQSFLTLSDYSKIGYLSDADNVILAKAINRMSIVSENGLFQTKVTSGKEINISEKLFLKIKDIIENSNNNQSKQRFMSIRFKTNAENGGGTTSPNDCVARAMSSVFDYFGCSTSYNDVNLWFQSQWGTNGVPYDLLIGVFDRYLNGKQITLSGTTFSSSNGMPSSGQKVIVVAIIGNELHAGVLMSCTNGCVAFTDNIGENNNNNNNNYVHIITLNQVVTAYQACGCK